MELHEYLGWVLVRPLKGERLLRLNKRVKEVAKMIYLRGRNPTSPEITKAIKDEFAEGEVLQSRIHILLCRWKYYHHDPEIKYQVADKYTERINELDRILENGDYID